MATTHKYVDKEGLQEFLKKLKAAYAENTVSTFVVNYAKNAGKAEGDENGNNIASTYLTKNDAKATYVPKAGYIAYSQAEKDKLAGIAAGAQVNVLEAVAVKGESIVTMSGKTATIDLDGYAKKQDIATVLDFKGVKATVADLPTTAKKGDVWIVTAGEQGANEEYVCVTSAGDSGHPKWEALGATIDFSRYVTKTDLQNAIAQEVSDRNAAIKVVSDDLADEVTRAQGAESALAGRLDIIEGDATTAGSIKKAVADEASARNTAITNAINGLDVTDISGDYIVAVGETDGKVHATAGTKGAIAQGATGLVDGGTVYSYVEGRTYNDHTYTFTSAASGREGEFTYEEFLNSSKVGQTHTITVNADKNKLESVKVNGTALTIDANKAVNIDMSAYTDQTLVTASAEPCSSAAVLAAGFAYESEFSRVTEAEIDELFGTTTV